MGAPAGTCAAVHNLARRMNAHPGCCDESSRLETRGENMSRNARSRSRLGAVAIGLLLAMTGAASAGSSIGSSIWLNGAGVIRQDTPYPYYPGGPYGIHDWRRGNTSQLNPTICALGPCSGGSMAPRAAGRHPW
jgi:hypothetical protein